MASEKLEGFLGSYADEPPSAAENEKEKLGKRIELPKVSSAPAAGAIGIIQALASKKSNSELFKCSKDSNLPADIMFAPLQGPLQPQQRWGGLEHAYNKSTIAGNVEKCVINDAAFDIQRHSFQRKGRAENPSDFSRPRVPPIDRKAGIAPSAESRSLEPLPAGSSAVSSSASLANQEYYKSQADVFPAHSLTRKERKARRIESGDPSLSSYLGPWAPPIAEQERRAMLEAEAREKFKDYQEEKQLEVIPEPEAPVTPSSSIAIDKTKITSIFHGKSEVSFQGLSWVEKPLNAEGPDEDTVNFLPKKLIHTYTGHTMGVQAIRFSPRYGHLLLSASLDTQCKIWDVENKRKCMRTYMGHTMGIRDIQFADDGKKFYSCSLDKTICLWDTETGKIIGSFTNDKTPYCLSVHPDRGMDHVFIIGSANKRAVQFDARSGEITQEYAEHLASVNTVTFCEDGRKIVTTADDKKMFVWEFGIPVVVKHIAEPHMHSMPAVRLHPSQKFLACQSMDNQIVVYEATGRFRFQGPKRFRGHSNSGYAIRPGFSTDGRFLMSGDVSGKVWFWDWKSLKNLRTTQAHDRVCLGSEWHPTAVSRVATCGWDGLVKLWE